MKKTEKDLKRQVEDTNIEDVNSKVEMGKLRERIIALARLSKGPTNVNSSYRKRMSGSSANGDMTPKSDVKRPKISENRPKNHVVTSTPAAALSLPDNSGSTSSIENVDGSRCELSSPNTSDNNHLNAALDMLQPHNSGLHSEQSDASVIGYLNEGVDVEDSRRELEASGDSVLYDAENLSAPVELESSAQAESEHVIVDESEHAVQAEIVFVGESEHAVQAEIAANSDVSSPSGRSLSSSSCDSDCQVSRKLKFNSKKVKVHGINPISRANMKKRKLISAPSSAINIALITESLEMCSIEQTAGLENMDDVRIALEASTHRSSGGLQLASFVSCDTSTQACTSNDIANLYHVKDTTAIDDQSPANSDDTLPQTDPNPTPEGTPARSDVILPQPIPSSILTPENPPATSDDTHQEPLTTHHASLKTPQPSSSFPQDTQQTTTSADTAQETSQQPTSSDTPAIPNPLPATLKLRQAPENPRKRRKPKPTGSLVKPLKKRRSLKVSDKKQLLMTKFFSSSSSTTDDSC